MASINCATSIMVSVLVLDAEAEREADIARRDEDADDANEDAGFVRRA